MSTTTWKDALVERAARDEAFKEALLEDPRRIIESNLKVKLPVGMKIKTVEETADQIYLVVPAGGTVASSGEVPDALLEHVSGGVCWENCDCCP